MLQLMNVAHDLAVLALELAYQVFRVGGHHLDLGSIGRSGQLVGVSRNQLMLVLWVATLRR